jgi:hypothetical protein
LHMYRETEAVTPHMVNTYLGFGHDPARTGMKAQHLHERWPVGHKQQGEPVKHSTHLNQRAPDLFNMPQKYWSPFHAHLIDSLQETGTAVRGAVSKKNTNDENLDYLHNVSIRTRLAHPDTGKSLRRRVPITLDSLSAIMRHGKYSGMADVPVYKQRINLIDADHIAGSKSHKLQSPHVMQSYFENVQTNLFGHIVVPFADVMQFASKVKRDPVQKDILQFFKTARRQNLDTAISTFWKRHLKKGADLNQAIKVPLDDHKFLNKKTKSLIIKNLDDVLTEINPNLVKRADTMPHKWAKLQKFWKDMMIPAFGGSLSLSVLESIKQPLTKFRKSFFQSGAPEMPLSWNQTISIFLVSRTPTQVGNTCTPKRAARASLHRRGILYRHWNHPNLQKRRRKRTTC